MGLRSNVFAFLLGILAVTLNTPKNIKLIKKYANSNFFSQSYSYENSEIPNLPNTSSSEEKSKIFAKNVQIQANDAPKIYTFPIQESKGQIYVGVGYGLANSIFIEDESGEIVIIDTTENSSVMEEIYRDVLKNMVKHGASGKNRKVKKVIFTHHHPDHIMGLPIIKKYCEENFNQNFEEEVEIIAHTTFMANQDRVAMNIRGTYSRGAGQFGNYLPEQYQVNSGLGPKLIVNEDMVISFLPPTKTFSTEMEFSIGKNLNFYLFHAPGETDDQINIFLTDENVLFIGDNFYESFPNLYAIRGVPSRNAKQWSNSLRKVIRVVKEKGNKHNAAPDDFIIIGSHFKPVTEDALQKIKTYADGIQFIHDNTVRLMNKGELTRQEIVNEILEIYPEKFSKFYYLREMYGTIEWSIKGIIDGYVGWFDGDVRNLMEIQGKEEKYLELIGGCEKVGKTVLELIDKFNYPASASDENDLLFALELISLCKSKSFKYDQIYRNVLKILANEQTNPLARNYYLKEALDIEVTFPDKLKKNTIRNKDGTALRGIFSALSTMFVPGYQPKTKSGTFWAQFKITDRKQFYNLAYDNYCYYSFEGQSIENSLLSVNNFKNGPHFLLAIEEQDLRDFLSSPGMAFLNQLFLKSSVEMHGEKLEFVKFLSYLRP